jgi:hypothetical protein
VLSDAPFVAGRIPPGATPEKRTGCGRWCVGGEAIDVCDAYDVDRHSIESVGRTWSYK